jgi:RecJ-like exonuclease
MTETTLTLNLEDSDIDCGWPCPKCGAKGQSNFQRDKSLRDGEGEVTHWTAHCISCGLTGIIWND